MAQKLHILQEASKLSIRESRMVYVSERWVSTLTATKHEKLLAQVAGRIVIRREYK